MKGRGLVELPVHLVPLPAALDFWQHEVAGTRALIGTPFLSGGATQSGLP